MIVNDCNLTEVIDINSGAVSVVHVNFYMRNRHRLVPTDEYYVLDSAFNQAKVNEERVAEARNFGKVAEEVEVVNDVVVEEEVTEDLPKVKPSKVTKRK